MKSRHSLTVAILLLAGGRISAATHFVSLENTNPTPPYTNWLTAATNIQDAIDASVVGDEVLVSNGVYAVGEKQTALTVSRVAVTNAITLRSVNGPQFTIIDGGGSMLGVQVFDGAILSGFTVTNGGAGDGGVYCSSTNVLLTNCVVTGNSGTGYDGGVGGGTLVNCSITGNTSWLGAGGGVYGAVLYNCTITGNLVYSTIDGAYPYGGGAYGCTLYNCTIAGNSNTEEVGGGVFGCTLYDCTITGNSAGWGGGADSSTLYNCTIAGNSDGVNGCNLYNCIDYFNGPAGAGPNYSSCNFTNCCTTPLPSSGDGNFASDPMFVDYPNGNLRLQPNSPCVDAGNNSYVFTATDLDDNARIVGAAVDMGAYEYPTSPGFSNLNFERSIITSSSPSGYGFNIGMANMPGWTEFNGWSDSNYSGGASVIYNNQTLDSPNVSLWDATYWNPAIQGNFSVALYGGSSAYAQAYPGWPTGASIYQTGQIQLTAKSITYWGNRLQVTFNGQMLLFYVISNAANYTVYGADVSAYSGQTGELRFTAPFENSGMLDNIQFSSTPLPELNGLIYITNDASITITGYNGPSTAVVIPSTINGHTVTSIGDYAFDYAPPTSITIPDSVTNIGNSVFYGDTSLTNVTIGQGVINIGANDFVDCISLNAIIVSPLNSSYTSIAGILFSKDTNTIIQYPSGITTGSYILPANVINIGASAFYQCGSLTNISIPSGVTNIGDLAFYSCTNLSGFIMLNKVISIGNAAFESCGRLTNVALGANLTNIGGGAFSGSGLTSITIPSTVANIGVGEFLGCASLTAITVDTNNLFYSSVDGVLFDRTQTTLIQYPTDKVGNFALPDTITSVGLEFQGLANLTGIAIPESVTNIEAGAFGGCASLAAITVDTNNLFYSSVDGVLFDKNQTTLIQYPNDKIGNFALPDTITSIGLEFEGLTNLTGITIPDSVTNIASWAFYQCFYLTNVTIGNNVTSIPYNAFSECFSLNWVTMGKSVAYIDFSAFDFCGSPLVGILFQGGPPQLGTLPFYGDPNVTFYYLPGAAGWTPQVLTSDGSFGVQSNQFGFNFTGTSGLVVIVQGSLSLEQPVWYPLATKTLAGGTTYFRDPFWFHFPARFYRLQTSGYDGYPVSQWNP